MPAHERLLFTIGGLLLVAACIVLFEYGRRAESSARVQGSFERAATGGEMAPALPNILMRALPDGMSDGRSNDPGGKVDE
jgi:hypothetical protein